MEKKNEIQVFTGDLGKLRMVTIDGKDYFIAKDVATILGYSNPRDAISRHCKGVVKNNNYKDGGNEISLINKDDICRLIQKAKTKSEEYKKEFSNWLIELKLIERVFILEDRKEIEFLDTLEEVLKPFNYTCIRQYPVCNNKYKIDLYIKDLNIAIEFDENNHRNYTYENHKGRQLEIEKELGCRFIRINDREGNLYNIGLFMKQLIKQ